MWFIKGLLPFSETKPWKTTSTKTPCRWQTKLWKYLFSNQSLLMDFITIYGVLLKPISRKTWGTLNNKYDNKNCPIGLHSLPWAIGKENCEAQHSLKNWTLSWIGSRIVHLGALCIRLISLLMAVTSIDALWTQKRYMLACDLPTCSNLWTPMWFRIWKETGNLLGLWFAEGGKCSCKISLLKMARAAVISYNSNFAIPKSRDN